MNLTHVKPKVLITIGIFTLVVVIATIWLFSPSFQSQDIRNAPNTENYEYGPNGVKAHAQRFDLENERPAAIVNYKILTDDYLLVSVLINEPDCDGVHVLAEETETSVGIKAVAGRLPGTTDDCYMSMLDSSGSIDFLVQTETPIRGRDIIINQAG